MIQEAAPGDTLAVFSTGAYNYSMSSNYNRIPKPPIVMVKAGSSRVIIKGNLRRFNQKRRVSAAGGFVFSLPLYFICDGKHRKGRTPPTA